MRQKFIDANVFLRFITKDDERKKWKIFKLFELADKGRVDLITLEVVIAEVVYILFSKKLYSLSAKKIKLVLTPIIEMRGLKMARKSTVLLALSHMVDKKIDFKDALIAASMVKQKIKEVYSYDRDFDKFKKIKRVEP